MQWRFTSVEHNPPTLENSLTHHTHLYPQPNTPTCNLEHYAEHKQKLQLEPHFFDITRIVCAPEMLASKPNTSTPQQLLETLFSPSNFVEHMGYDQSFGFHKAKTHHYLISNIDGASYKMDSRKNVLLNSSNFNNHINYSTTYSYFQLQQ